MTNRTESLVDEICRIAPELAGRREDLVPLVTSLLEARPEATIDAAFVAELRGRLMAAAAATRPKPNLRLPSFFTYPSFALAGAVVLLLLVVAAPVIYDRWSGSRPVAMVESVGREAFGSLAGAGGPGATAGSAIRGQGGGGGPMSAAAPAFGGDIAEGTVTKDIMPSPMIAPPEMIRVEYAYSGALPELAESGLVYKRVAPPASRAVRSLLDLDLGLADFASFANPKVTQFTMEDESDAGYLIYVDLVRGSVSINTNWRNVMPLGAEGKAVMPPTGRPENASDATVIAIANAFLAEHGISRGGYGDPVVIRPPEYRTMAEGSTPTPAAESMPVYYQPMLTVRYPLLVGGVPAFEQHGEEMGLSVNVDATRKRVQDVYGLEAQSYQSSEYPLLTDTGKILDAARRGGFTYGPYPMPMKEGMYPVREGEPYPTERVITVSLGEPKEALVRFWRMAPGVMKEADELLIPALVFPVTGSGDPSGQWYVQRNVIVPLIPDLVFQPLG